MTEQLWIISSILFNLADLVGAVACLMCDCDVQLDIIFIKREVVVEEDKGCPVTMGHLDPRPHPDYIDISQLINTFDAGVFIEEKLLIVRLFSLIYN